MKREKEQFVSEELRERLSGLTGREYWRSLEELADSPEFQKLLEEESPRHAALWFDAIDRRDFLKVMAASIALAAGCRSPAPAPTDENSSVRHSTRRNRSRQAALLCHRNAALRIRSWCDR